MDVRQIFPLNLFFEWSTNISLLDTIEVLCVRMAHTYRYLADLSSFKGCEESCSWVSNAWAIFPQLERKLESLRHCQAVGFPLPL